MRVSRVSRVAALACVLGARLALADGPPKTVVKPPTGATKPLAKPPAKTVAKPPGKAQEELARTRAKRKERRAAHSAAQSARAQREQALAVHQQTLYAEAQRLVRERRAEQPQYRSRSQQQSDMRAWAIGEEVKEQYQRLLREHPFKGLP